MLIVEFDYFQGQTLDNTSHTYRWVLFCGSGWKSQRSGERSQCIYMYILLAWYM